MPSVDVGIIQPLLHPPLGFLTTHLDGHGPYSGNVELSVWSSTVGPIYTDLNVSDTFGVYVTINGSIPAGWGFITGWVSDDAQYDEAIYEERLAQIVVQHQLLSGLWVSTQIVELRSFPHAVLWDTALPGRIGLLVAPGLAVDLFYLLVG